MKPGTVYRSVEVIHEMQDEAGLANTWRTPRKKKSPTTGREIG
jgi:hypothetical protein